MESMPMIMWKLKTNNKEATTVSEHKDSQKIFTKF
jgi:hypothetical protein